MPTVFTHAIAGAATDCVAGLVRQPLLKELNDLNHCCLCFSVLRTVYRYKRKILQSGRYPSVAPKPTSSTCAGATTAATAWAGRVSQARHGAPGLGSWTDHAFVAPGLPPRVRAGRRVRVRFGPCASSEAR
jgi:hypothetical protein